MKINDYLLDNPKAVEGLFTKIFGKYMLRYYDTQDYSVTFSTHEDTSYQDSKNKRIVISLNNVIAMLQKDVNVLAVAYHELAHTLYTNDIERDKIRQKTYDLISQHLKETLKDSHQEYNISRLLRQDHIVHNVWNTVEDTRIERLLMKDFPFLKDIVDPLRTIIDPHDDELFKWRTGIGTPSPTIVELAEDYCSPKKKSQIHRAAILRDIIVELYLQEYIDKSKDQYTNPDPQAQSGKTKARETFDNTYGDPDIANEKAKQQRQMSNAQKEIQTKEDYKKDLEKRVQALDKQLNESTDRQEKQRLEHIKNMTQQDIESVENQIEQVKSEIEKDIGKPFEKVSQESEKTKLDQIKYLETNNSQEKAIKDILEDMQKTEVELSDMKKYTESISHYDKSQTNSRNFIKEIYSPKQALRNGISAAQSKKYSLNLSHKVNVSRIVNSKANRTAPQVFYNRGKDLSFTKKVVIFQDVSGSTRQFSHTFSSIAYSLAKAFDSVEWWGYGDKLFKKDPQDYKIETYSLANEHRVFAGNGTRADRLLHVMKQYKNKDYTYVIITDGDMNAIFNDIDTWNVFKDKIAVVGLLDNEIKTHAPHNVDLLEIIAKRKGYNPRPDDNTRNIVDRARITIDDLTIDGNSANLQLITRGINGVIELVKSRIA